MLTIPASMRRRGRGRATALTALTARVTALKLCTRDATVVDSTPPERVCARAVEGTGAAGSLGAGL